MYVEDIFNWWSPSTRKNKLSAHQPIIKAEIPAKAAILLGQHIGAPAKPIVAKGDVVKVGTKIAEPGGFVSAAIHSSVSGKVAKIDTIVDASGYAKPAIFIDVEGMNGKNPLTVPKRW